MKAITESSWLSALKSASTPPRGSFTTKDVRERTGMSESGVRDSIERAIRRGEIEYVGTFRSDGAYRKFYMDKGKGKVKP